MPDDAAVARWLMAELAALMNGRLPAALSVDERVKLAVLVDRIDRLVAEIDAAYCRPFDPRAELLLRERTVAGRA